MECSTPGYSDGSGASFSSPMLLSRNGSKRGLGLFVLGALVLGAHGCSDAKDDSPVPCEGDECEVQTGTGTVAVGEACDETEECVPGSVCFNEYCVGAGTLRVSLAFSVDADFDLHVLTPGGSEIYFANKEANGGKLDVDQCVVSCGTDPHVENIVFDETALAGEYTVWVVNYEARAAGDFRIQVAGDVSATFEGSLPAASNDGALEDPESTHFTFTL